MRFICIAVNECSFLCANVYLFISLHVCLSFESVYVYDVHKKLQFFNAPTHPLAYHNSAVRNATNTYKKIICYHFCVVPLAFGLNSAIYDAFGKKDTTYAYANTCSAICLERS